MADNDDYEIQYYKYLEKIGMTPPNVKVRQTPQKQNNSGISQRLLFQNSSQKKELNYQRINSIIVLNNQLEINLTNKQNQSKILNISSNQESKSPIFDIQTSLIQPNEQKNEKGLSQIDEFADEYQQETSNKTNCYDSNIRQEQNNNNINLDFSSIQLKPLITNKFHEDNQNQTEQDNQQLQQCQDNDNQISLCNNQDLNIKQNQQSNQSCQHDPSIKESNQELSKQNSQIKIIIDQNQDEEIDQEQLQQQIRIQNENIEKINIVDLDVNNKQNLESQPQIEMNPKIETPPKEINMQEQKQDEYTCQIQSKNVDINYQESSDIQLQIQNNDIGKTQIQVSDNHLIINQTMEIEKIQESQINQEQQIIKQYQNNQVSHPLENKLNNDQQNNINQQQSVEQRLIQKKKKKQKKSRIINKKKKKEKKNKVEQNEQKLNDEKKQSYQIIDCENKQILQIEEKPNNEQIIIEQEQKNPICNLLQSLIKGFYGENIKINWNKYTFLKKKIQKKRSILLKSKLLI
ncbi:unnamed protein product [Paramecium pentaurelia]|uniref:Uncharacterized protein n=1 Tax=Paramecium pentaurelia TaxID=43138 RepID=A0A8S1RYX4_9CILI|nr:unnamed protein product [Paramecium pentaurelia]